MTEDLLRPRVRDLVLCLYERSLHPELFETLVYRRIERAEGTLTIRLTPSGHVLSWQTRYGILTEVTAACDPHLPRSGRLFQRRFQAERTGTLDPGFGVRYQTGSQLEILPPEIFLHVHDEIVADGAKRGMLYNHQPHHRLALCPIDYVTVEVWRGTVSINTFHTFPAECALVKTQALIESC